jgi:Zn-dependent M16 (insulinase) family peptidase
MNSPFLQKLQETYLDFKVLRCTRIEELNCYFREIIHEPTGAQILHIENDDPENLFCLSFRTLPHNSRGAPHILEHVVLCGSKKFPIKDPFFSMTRRSLNTYMNALTGSDFTCYPAASQVEQDFYNLLDVYLDAVFQPQIKQLSFLQEGCRLEFTKPEDLNSPLQFKGIVYNEMKGAMSNPEDAFVHKINENLLGQELTIMGWVATIRNLGGLLFCDIRDRSGIVQISFPKIDQFNFSITVWLWRKRS